MGYYYRAAAQEEQQFGPVPTKFDRNCPVQSQKHVRSLKFWVKEEGGLYYPCSGNKDADQLCSYCTADLRLCFCLCMLLVFVCGGLILQYMKHSVSESASSGCESVQTLKLFTCLLSSTPTNTHNDQFMNKILNGNRHFGTFKKVEKKVSEFKESSVKRYSQIKGTMIRIRKAPTSKARVGI